MITQIKRGGVVTGVTVSGPLSRDPVCKMLGGKPVLSLSVRAHSEKNASGNYDSTFVEVLCWGGIEERDGMYEKGDYITAEGRELRRDDKGNGKVYYSLNATGITPGDLVVLRWMQMAINIAVGPAEASAPPAPQPLAPASDAPPDALLPAPALAGAELYPGGEPGGLPAAGPAAPAAAGGWAGPAHRGDSGGRSAVLMPPGGKEVRLCAHLLGQGVCGPPSWAD